MAQRVTTLLICDLCEDETEGIDTIVFGIGTERFEIDACEQHVNEIRGTLGRYSAAGRKASGGVRSMRATRDTRVAAAGDILRAADLTAEEKDLARSLGWKGKRLSKEISDQIKAGRS